MVDVGGWDDGGCGAGGVIADVAHWNDSKVEKWGGSKVLEEER